MGYRNRMVLFVWS